MFQALLSEYRVNLNREVGYNPDRPNVSRRRMVAFADAVPSLRIAVALKVELFRGVHRRSPRPAGRAARSSRAGPERPGRPHRLGLRQSMGRLLSRLGRPGQQRHTSASSGLTAAISEAGKVPSAEATTVLSHRWVSCCAGVG